PVPGRRRLEQVAAARRRVVRRDPVADDRDHQEEADDGEAGDRLAAGEEPEAAPARDRLEWEGLGGLDVRRGYGHVSPPSGYAGRGPGRRRRRTGSPPA